MSKYISSEDELIANQLSFLCKQFVIPWERNFILNCREIFISGQRLSTKQLRVLQKINNNYSANNDSANVGFLSSYRKKLLNKIENSSPAIFTFKIFNKYRYSSATPINIDDENILSENMFLISKNIKLVAHIYCHKKKDIICKTKIVTGDRYLAKDISPRSICKKCLGHDYRLKPSD